MTHDVIVILAALGVAGQVLAVVLLLVGLAWLLGLHGPGDWLRWTLEGYVELYCRASTPPQAIRAAVERFPEVVDASTISGEADALLRIVAFDMHHFERVLEQIGSQRFVARTKSVLVLSALLRRPVTPLHPAP